MVLAERLKQELVNRRIMMNGNGIRERIIESVEEILKETKSRIKVREGGVKNKGKVLGRQGEERHVRKEVSA